MNFKKIFFLILVILILPIPSCNSSPPQSDNIPTHPEDSQPGPSDSGDNPENSDPPLPDDSNDDDSSPQTRLPDSANECITLALSQSAIDIGSELPAGYEPSGADWHPRLEEIFSVHDNGNLFSMEKNGSNVRTWNIGGDLEGITIPDPQSDFIYIGREFPAAVLEFNLVTGLVTRTFSLGGENGMPEDSAQGLEALTFVEISGHPEGGQFWAGHQGNGKIYAFELPIVSSKVSTEVQLIDIFEPVPGRTDLSGMDYSPEFDVVYVIYDSSNKLSIVDPENGTLYYDRDLPQTDQEGIAVNDLCDLFIAQDTQKKFWYYPGSN